MDKDRIFEICADEALSQQFVDACDPYNLEYVFLLAVPHFRANPYQNEALNICRRYLDDGAERELNIRPATRHAAARDVHRLTQDAVADPDLFNACFEELLAMLQANIVQGNLAQLDI